MRCEIIVVVISAYCLSAVFARMPPLEPEQFCESRLIGPACITKGDCKPGYSCKHRLCCRDPVCPKGWIEGGSCNLIPGQQRCPDLYQCINNFCCKDTTAPPPPKCPAGTTQVPGTCSKYPTSYYGRPRCPYGSKCHQGICCKTVIQPDLCPKVKPPRECPIYKKSPDECKTDADCFRGVCCKGPCGERFCYNIFPVPLKG